MGGRCQPAWLHPPVNYKQTGPRPRSSMPERILRQQIWLSPAPLGSRPAVAGLVKSSGAEPYAVHADYLLTFEACSRTNWALIVTPSPYGIPAGLPVYSRSLLGREPAALSRTSSRSSPRYQITRTASGHFHRSTDLYFPAGWMGRWRAFRTLLILQSVALVVLGTAAVRHLIVSCRTGKGGKR